MKRAAPSCQTGKGNRPQDVRQRIRALRCGRNRCREELCVQNRRSHCKLPFHRFRQKTRLPSGHIHPGIWSIRLSRPHLQTTRQAGREQAGTPRWRSPPPSGSDDGNLQWLERLSRQRSEVELRHFVAIPRTGVRHLAGNPDPPVGSLRTFLNHKI